MITENYVSFETAKLLKEKGFDVDECEVHYDPEDHTQYDITQQMAMKWLREEHNLVVSVEPEINTDSELDLFYVFKIFEIKNTLTRLIYNGYELCDSYEEACEAAIKYCLENLV